MHFPASSLMRSDQSVRQRFESPHSAVRPVFSGRSDSPSPDKEEKAPAQTFFQKLILALTLAGAGVLGYQIYKHTPHNPPVSKMEEIPVSKALKILEGVAMTGVEPNSYIIRDMGSQKIYSLRGIEETMLGDWFQEGAWASVRGTRIQVEEKGVKKSRFLVDSIDPANLLREPPKTMPLNPADKTAPVRLIHLMGTVSQDEVTKVWTLTDDLTNETVELTGHTPQKLAAWFRHNVAVTIMGRDSRRRDNIIQGLPFDVEAVRPVRVPKTIGGME